MSTLIASADGNLTGSTTFAAAEVGALALTLVRNTTALTPSAAATTSTTFTVTAGKVIDAVLLWVRVEVANPTGTFKVDLQKGGVSQASVTVNKTDLPEYLGSITYPPVPMLFKLTTTATGDGAANWTIVVTTTGTAQVRYNIASATTTNFTKALRTTTSATPAAADDLYIVGELTGAGTKNTRIVTMNSTAATAYGNGAVNSTSVNGGGIHISNWGTLTYAGVGGSSYATLDGTPENVTVTGSGLIATHHNTSSFSGVRSTAFKSSGKYYFEATLGATHGGNDTIGMSLSSAVVYSSAEGACTINFASGRILADGSNTGKTLGSDWAAGNVICFAIDLDNRKAWLRKSTGDWNNEAIGISNPATATGGVSFNAGNYSPGVTFGSSATTGDQVTMNFGASAFAGAAPSGFTSGWGTVVAGGGNYILRVAGDVIVYQYGTLNMGSSAGPPASTAILEFQQVSADGDFGLRCLDNSTVTITGQPRTAGKNIVKCKLTADVAGNNILTSGPAAQNGATSFIALEATGNSLLAGQFTDNATSGSHGASFGTAIGVTNTTQTATVWLARGSGTNNRYVRVTVGNSGLQSSVTTGFYSDIDLQAGTAGTVTAVGTGTATSVSITPVGAGYLVRMTGKLSSGGPTNSSLLLNSCAVAATPSYVGNTTQCFIYDHVALVTAASISDTIFNVDADTGWLSGDAICIASTTRTASECEVYPLNANAGASSFTSMLYPFGIPNLSYASTHHGTSPTQAEIGLITRNVKIRSTSTTLMSYVYCTALSTVTASWAEFYYVGASSTGKRGIEVDGGAVCNPKSFTYCSLHDCDNTALLCANSAAASLNLTFSNNVLWLNVSGSMLVILSAVSNSDWTFSGNLLMRPATNGFNLVDVGGICTNNTVVGSATPNYGFLLAAVAVPATPITLGNFAGNTAHSGSGLNCATVGLTGTINNFTAWRNNTPGVAITAAASSDLISNNLVLFGNSGSSTANLTVSAGDVINMAGISVIAGDASFATAYGINVSALANLTQINLSSVDMSGAGAGFAPHTTTDIYTGSTTLTHVQGTANNCKFGAPNLTSAKTYWAKGANIGFQKFNQTAGDHRTEMTYGQLRTDSVVYHTAAPSMKMTPNNASNRLESAPKNEGILAAVNSGGTVTASVWVRKDATYTGSQPRLIVRANAAIGINSDTVLATYSAGTGVWNQIGGTAPAATDDGVMEFVVDCDGTSGFINVDDWSFS